LEKRTNNEPSTDAATLDLGLLTQLLPGIGPGSLVLVCGGRVTGKTQLLLQMGLSAALQHGIRTVIHAPATDTSDIQDRVMALASGVGVRRLQAGQLRTEDWNVITAAASELAQAPLIVTDDVATPMEDILDGLDHHLDRLADIEPKRPGLCLIDSITSVAAHGRQDYSHLDRIERTYVQMLRRWLQRSGHVAVASVLGLPDVTGARGTSGAVSLVDHADAAILLETDGGGERLAQADRIVCRVLHHQSGRRVSTRINLDPWALQLDQSV